MTSSCIVLNGPSPDATVKMTFYSLAPLQVADNEGEPVAKHIPAVWRHVSLRDHSPITLVASDCELVAQFRDQILPLFTSRNIMDRTRCRPGENAAYQLNLQFEALYARPPVDKGTK